MTAGPVFTVNVGFGLSAGGANGFYDISHYDTDTPAAIYAGTAATVVSDIGHYVRFQDGVTIHRGASGISDTSFHAEAGTFSCTLDNRDRRFDPLFTTGAYTMGGFSFLQVGNPVTVQVTAFGTTQTLFTGFVDAWPQTYPARHRDQTCQMKATDGTLRVANAQVPNTFTRPSESTGARIEAIIAEIDPFKVITRSVDTGVTLLPPLIRGTTSAWSTVQDINDAEWGDLYIAVDGKLTFRDRMTKLTASRSKTSQATFGDAGGAEIPFFDVTMADTLILNDVTIVYDDSGGSVNTIDSVSIIKPAGRRSQNKAIPFARPFDALSLASWIVYIYGADRARFATLQVKPLRSAATFAQVARELGDRITIKLTPQGGGSRITRECWIRGIQHEFHAGDWTMTFTLEDASSVAAIGYYNTSHYDTDTPAAVYAL